MSSLLFTFESEDKREKFIALLSSLESKGTAAVSKFIRESINTAIRDPKIREDKDKIVSLFVSGKELKKDSYPVIKKAFDVEITAHSGSVEIREKKSDGTWKVIQSRRSKK